MLSQPTKGEEESYNSQTYKENQEGKKNTFKKIQDSPESQPPYTRCEETQFDSNPTYHLRCQN